MKASEILCHTLDFNAFVLDKKLISFAQYQSDTTQYCATFKNIAEDRVVLYIPDDLYLFYCCFMGLLHAGKDIILPSYLTQKTANDMFEYSSAFVTNQPFETDRKLIYPTKSDEKNDLKPISNRTISFFTSGSTGKPKLIKKTFDMLDLEVQMHSQMHQLFIQKKPTLIASVMPSHMFGMLWRFLLPLSNQLKQDLDTIISPEEIQEKQNNYKNILMVTTPTFMNEVASYSEEYQFKKNCLAIYSAGSLLNKKTSEKMFDLFGVSPFEVFASTETGGVAYRQQNKTDKWRVFDVVKIKQNDQQCLRVESSPFSFVCPFDMQDLIKLDTPETFEFLGRNDRIVKIAENRVDLNEMEERLLTCPFIKEVHLTTFSTSKNSALAAIICLNTTGIQALKASDKLSLIQKIKKHLSAFYEKSVLPKKFRFVHQIPKNPQGKILKKDILEILNSSVPEPVVENLKYDENNLSADLTFLKDSIYFQGHFPNHPILPGVIQLHFVFYFLKRYFNEEVADKYTIHKLKFTNLILPNTPVHFEISRQDKNSYLFTYTATNKSFSSGQIKFGETENV